MLLVMWHQELARKKKKKSTECEISLSMMWDYCIPCINIYGTNFEYLWLSNTFNT